MFAVTPVTLAARSFVLREPSHSPRRCPAQASPPARDYPKPNNAALGNGVGEFRRGLRRPTGDQGCPTAASEIVPTTAGSAYRLTPPAAGWQHAHPPHRFAAGSQARRPADSIVQLIETRCRPIHLQAVPCGSDTGRVIGASDCHLQGIARCGKVPVPRLAQSSPRSHRPVFVASLLGFITRATRV